MLNWPSKSPGERLDFDITWPIGTDTILSSTWTISDPALTTDEDSFSVRTSVIWLLGGTPNALYTVTNTITTAGTRVYVQQVNIKVVSST